MDSDLSGVCGKTAGGGGARGTSGAPGAQASSPLCLHPTERGARPGWVTFQMCRPTAW